MIELVIAVMAGFGAGFWTSGLLFDRKMRELALFAETLMQRVRLLEFKTKMQ